MGGMAVAWPLSGYAQQPDKLRRVGVLMTVSEDHPEGQAGIAVFLQHMQQLGWVGGRNLQIDTLWSGGSDAKLFKDAAAVMSFAPDVILAMGANVGPLLQISGAVPIVLVNGPDPLRAGYVRSLARPGGNVTGFFILEYSFNGKWLELIKQIAPKVSRVGIIWESKIASGPALFSAVRSVASSFGLEANFLTVRDADEIEQSITKFRPAAPAALIITASPLAITHRKLIIALAARHKLPTIYFHRIFPVEGGLISYAPDYIDQFRRAAEYVDRILRGEKAADMPVQAPTKYNLVLNLNTAKTLGLTIPNSLVASANELIDHKT